WRDPSDLGAAGDQCVDGPGLEVARSQGRDGVDAEGPDLPAPLPWLAPGEVRAAGDERRVATDPGNRAGEPPSGRAEGRSPATRRRTWRSPKRERRTGHGPKGFAPTTRPGHAPASIRGGIHDGDLTGPRPAPAASASRRRPATGRRNRTVIGLS